ncbi:MAG: cob(I)yrinic acid a,c-diamide adenosyltransferase [Planctomycetales bacterium]|nr:cob(I)yrinic acid a,c-diamide adenosyltransferase [Planctomycetales bacterium]MCA9169995.1 cob(I)yrinic acid a,c-diamide adenosyltransferase [Planctomycetales bacterium]
MKIYTKQGDAGETGLYGGSRVAKDDIRIEAYGTLDELSACLGQARAAGLDAELDELLQTVQCHLFVIGAQLASPLAGGPAGNLPDSAAHELEAAIDRWENELSPLKNFILPGGTTAAAALHLARVVCRRAERRVVTLDRRDAVAPATIPYLNRLGDALFVAARVVNSRAQVADVPWQPPQGPDLSL